jgi:hypothetical protein
VFADRLSRGYALPADQSSLPLHQRAPAPASRAASALLIVYVFVIAAGLGLSSAHRMTAGEYPFGRVHVGAWTVWPRSGSREADPYTRAVNARTGTVPLGVGEGLVLRATADEAGRALDARCTYRIGATTPQARFWTLTLYDAGGRAAETPLGRGSFSSAELLREQDGAFAITVSREAASGNWLMMPERGEVSLMLRLYDSPASVGSAALDARVLPRVERLECAP